MPLYEWIKELSEASAVHAVAMNYMVLTFLYIMLTAIYNRTDRIFTHPPYRALIGLLFGFFACAAIMVPAVIAEGVITDSRLAIISFAGIFFGPAAAIAATIPPVILRAAIGGDGALIGIVSMLLVMSGSGGFGYWIRKYNKGYVHLRWIVLYICAMFPVCTTTLLLLPDTMALKMIVDGGVYILLINVVGAWLLGYMLCQDQSRRMMMSEMIDLHHKAEKAAAAKTLFMARMSHELRTPMNSIIGFSDLLRSTPLNDEQRYYLEQLKTAGRTMTALVSDILDFSKIGSGKLALDINSFNLSKLVESCGTLIAPEALKKNLDVSIQIDPLCPEWVRGDELRIRQILMNLLCNAVKFTNRGKITLRCTASIRSDSLYNIVFFVEDTGIGIAPDKQREMFKAFEQIDSSITRERGGAGLGLSIACELVRMMEGEIDLTSTPDAGTTFTFHVTLPAAFPVIMPGEKRDIPVVENRKRILIVEDIAMNQEMVSHMLSKLGYNSDIAHNGGEALARLAENPYDLVLMDLQMPVLNGYETALRIRRDLRIGHEAMPIVALTAHALPEETAKCFEAGMDDFLIKPIEFSELAAKIDEWLENGGDSWDIRPRDGTAYENAPLLSESDVKEFTGFVGEHRIREAYDDFLSDQKTFMAHVKSHHKDTNIMRAGLHNIASTSGNLGMKKLSLYARHLLDQGAAHDRALEAAEIDLIDNLFRESCRTFEKYISI